MYYALAAVAALLFSSQFLMHRQYERRCGDSLAPALVFSAVTSGVMAVMMLIINGFKVEITLFSFLTGLAAAIINLLFVYFSNRAFYTADLGVYSCFAMLGGMLLPAVCGIAFYDEPLTAGKLICTVLIAVSLTVTLRPKKTGGKACFFYIAVFILNGLFGVVSKLHQSGGESAVSSQSFLGIASVIQMVLSITVLLLIKERVRRPGVKPVLFASGYSVLNGVGNLLMLIALLHLPASVQYPLVTGGTVVFSAIIAAVSGARLDLRGAISVVLAVAASVAVVL